MTSRFEHSKGAVQMEMVRMPKKTPRKILTPRNPRLVPEEEVNRMLTPSEFLKEMSLTTEQRLAKTHFMCRPQIIELLDMEETTHQKTSKIDLDQALFQPFPSEIIFQNYMPCEVYEVPLILRNNDTIPRMVKVVEESSPYFKVISPKDVGHKVAPGVPSTFRVLFTPEENKDYAHMLTCVTEREKFIVPIKARGARAILDFPDTLNFSICPVKYNSQKTLLVRNIGNKEAVFHIETQRPFSIQPPVGTLRVGESMQMEVQFEPQTVGNHSQKLIVCYDTGEEVFVSLYGAAIDMNIRLDKNSLIIEKTYISLTNQRIITIHNRSKIIAHFQWKIFATQEDEEREKHRACDDLTHEEQEETDEFLKECDVDPSLRERLSILSRTFENQRRRVQTDSMLFFNSIFTIEPLEGDVWPNTSAEIIVYFNPREARLYQQTVYCDISGRESRMPLRIKGEGLGPKIQFNFELLDIGKIFVGSVHCYETVLSNKGSIDALFNLIPPVSVFGTCFTFSPKEGIIERSGVQALQICFTSSTLGHFEEEFLFNVSGSPEPVKLTIRGCVIGPTFHFNVPALHFGDISFGFPRTLICSLNNTSLVSMTFKLRIPGDGVDHSSFSACEKNPDQGGLSWNEEAKPTTKPKEFTITPDSGTIRPQGFTAIRVTLCSNTVQKYELALVVDVEGIGEEVLALLVTARCIVPTLELVNSEVNFGHCFLKYPYEKTVALSNKSHLPGAYKMLLQAPQGSPPAMLLSSPSPCGIIQAHSTIHIPLSLETQIRGEHCSLVSISTFGSQDPPMICKVRSIGEGPVIYVHPLELDFGSIYVLQNFSKVLNLSNQSFIPALFRAYMAHKKSLWTIEPSQGLVPPEADVQLTLTANLNDTVTFKDTVVLEIENSITYHVPVQASGFGSTIVSDKPFAPELNLGAHFSLDTYVYRFKLTNKGRRAQQLFWMNEGFQPKARKSLPKIRPRKKFPTLQGSKDPQNPVFQIHPIRMELQPGQTINVTLQGYSAHPRVVQERLVCHAMIGTQQGINQVMTVRVLCEFIEPLLQLSTKQLTYRLEKTPSCVLEPEYQPLVMKNVSSLPVSILLSLCSPFFICESDKSPLPLVPEPIRLSTQEEKSLLVKFDPSLRTDLNNWVAEEMLSIKYIEHPQVDSVNLRGEVYYPNLCFETMDLNFGCILNDTEVIRYINITNCSPLTVKFRWFFLVEDEEDHIRFERHLAKPHSATVSQVESSPVTSPSTCSQVVPMTEVPETNIGDYIKAILVDEEIMSEERELKKTDGPMMTAPDVRLILNSVEIERVDLNQSQTELQDYIEIFPHEDLLSIGIEEVFDILPLCGVLQPYSTHQISFTFFGHCDIIARAKALCEVEGGPTYEVILRGEASLINYSFDTKDINFGLQPFDHVTVKEITLRNTGQVGFEFKVLAEPQSAPNNLLPGVPLLLPSSAFIGSQEEAKLKIYYLPGVPEIFHRSFQIQIAHLEPEKITLSGEGVFPRINVDLPRNLKGAEKYQIFLNQARKNLEKEYSKYEIFDHLDIIEEMLDDESSEISAQIHMEVERLIVQDYAIEHHRSIPDPTEDISHRCHRKLSKVQLPEYILDFGYIILGDVRTHIIKITNTSHFPVSFHADKRVLHDTGFSTELDRVKNLPYCETETFEVRFDSQGTTHSVGSKETLLPIKVVGGPTVYILLQAKVLIPAMTLSCGKVEFAAIQCGQCLVETIQLSNQHQVPCEWFVSISKPVDKLEKHMPKYLRRRLCAELKPKARIFEIQPTSGILDPCERFNVQVKFMPKEEKFYSQTLVFQIAQSSQRLTLLAQGWGLEPRLEFSPSILELGPLLPFAPGDEMEVVVKNPCNFPIEFYSLEFDQQYLVEEKILRMLKGYDAYNTLLLPPRPPGEKLPPEIYEYYKEVKRSREEQMKMKYLENLAQDNDDDDLPLSDHGTSGSTKRTSLSQGLSATSNTDERHIAMVDSKIYAEEEDDEESLEKMLLQVDKNQSLDSHSTEEVGEVESNPVNKAIARYLGIDISPEARMAKNRKGIVIIVHGTPLSGKTATAISLAKYYNAACLNIDSIMLEAICDSSSFPGIRARELCIRAAIEQALKEGEESAQEAASGQTRLSSETLGKLTSETILAALDGKPGKTLRGSVPLNKGKVDSHGSGSQKQHHMHSDTPQISSSPLPLGPTQRRLSVSTSIGGETGLMSCVLPEELFVQILSDRLELSDCYRGVVFDSLETLFSRNMTSTLHSLLKAIGNREHIYLLNMAQDYMVMKAQEKAKKEQEENKRREELEKEKERLRTMDEDEYDALTEEEKMIFNREVQQALRERKKRELERLAKEQQEKKLQQELERQKEEDELRRKIKKPKMGKEEVQPKKSHATGLSFSRPEGKADLLERKTSVREQIQAEKEDQNKKKKTLQTEANLLGNTLVPEPEDSEGDLSKDTDRYVAQRFKDYELTLKDIQGLLLYWDRKQRLLLPHTGVEDSVHEPDDQRQVPTGGRKGRKDRERAEKAEKERAEKERQEREKAERERLEKLRIPDKDSDGWDEGEEDHESKKDLGVPFINIPTPDPEGVNWKQTLENERLPRAEQILDLLGLGSSGPPIPPPALFSIISYPNKRLPLATTETLKHFVFVVPPSEESSQEDKREVDPDVEPTIPTGSTKVQEDQNVSSKSSKQKQKDKEKQEQPRETVKEKRRPQPNRKPVPGTTTGTIPTLSDIDQNNLTRQQSQEKFMRLSQFRWIVPANGEVTLRIHFSSGDVGSFDQTLNFEILGTHRQYQLYCRGICSYPYICQDPKVVFSERMPDIKPDEVIFKKYVMSTEKFYFGPLLCGKSRDKYKSPMFPGNTETLTILNNSPMPSEVFFCFQNDVKASTYFLEPLSMVLKPNESQLLHVWAYPTAVGLFEDSVVCCVKENPEPAIFNICCQGVRPELELEPKQLHFDRLLLHRRETKVIILRNITPLPASWRVSSLEHLGEDFALPVMQGIIAPKSEYGLPVHFQPSKPVSVKKTIRLEILDVDNLVGIVQVENVMVFAESYDIALDIVFPKGADGGLDFGTVKVMEDVRQLLLLKNRGKYEIMFSFSVDPVGAPTNISSMISVQPRKGSLTTTEKPMNVHVYFRARKEVRIDHQPILRCQIIEPGMAEGGEVIASIPIKFSVNAVYSKYVINPSNIINFGALICGTRKSSSFTIENQGVTDFKFVLFRMTGELPIYQKKGTSHLRNPRSRESDSFHKGTSLKASKFSESLPREVNFPTQARFTHGMFTVYPGFGAIVAGGSQVITVDCLADPIGKSEEYVGIDISDRDPRDQPGGIPYMLLAEACLPAFVTDDYRLIFEEHQVCQSASLSNTLQTTDSGGVFVEDENRFLFSSVLVGHQAKARFKIINPGKIACDVSVNVKPVSSKIFARITDIFDVEPNKICVPSRSSAFATVSFTPQALQTYQCIFEVTVEGLSSNLTKNRNLSFDIVGEGTLPRVTVVRPILHDQFGNPLLLFKRLLIGRSQTLPIQLKNTGTIEAQLHIDLRDPLGIYSLKGKPTTTYNYLTEDNKPQAVAKKAHTASLVIHPGETAEFDVLLQSQKVGRMTGEVHLSVVHNQYEETIIHLVGEGYEDDITLDNIHGLVTSTSQESDISLSIEEITKEELVAAAMIEHIQFGDCHVGYCYTLSFTLTNHSKVNVIRFEWPVLITVSFSPQIGHLHPGCAKDIMVTLNADIPISLKKMGIKCKLSKIVFQLPTDQVPDWDDRMHTVKWVDMPRTTPGVFTTKRKVVETDPEPAHSVIEENHQDLYVQISANVSYAQYTFPKHDVHFKETLVYQTRIFEMELTNSGTIQLEFSWTCEEAGRVVSFATPEGQESTQKLQLSQGTLHTASTVDSTTDHWPETSVPPFSVEPSSGVLPVGKTQKLFVKFSPLEVGDFECNLYCQISNLSPGEQGPVVTARGRSCMPYCHFDLKDSDYISGHRRDADLRGPGGGSLDPATRVIEFTSLGIGGKNLQSFTILNPTSSTYSFSWVSEETESLQNLPVFTCLTEKGIVYPEKKAEIIFQFTPTHLDITEAFWTFLIPEHNISVPFLLVGKASDPLLNLSKAHINFSSLLIGREAREKVRIINQEDQGFYFAFVDNSRYSEGHSNCLIVSPMEGWIPPKSRIPIDIFFTPKLEGEVNFNLICNVKKKVNPLTLNVKAEGYAMNAEVKFKDKSGTSNVLTPAQTNTVNLYEVELNESVQYEFSFLNMGKFSFSYQAELSGPKTLLQYLEFAPVDGSVDAGQSMTATLFFRPQKKCVLKNLELRLKISHGPTFVCSIIGSVVIPAVHFSFTSYNFGNCFIYQAGMPPYKQSLIISNKDENAMSIDCLYTNTSYLEVNFHRDVIKPGKSLEIPITFYPRESIAYRETLPFEINGLSQQLVEIRGSGTELKITVSDPPNRVVKLGAIHPGQEVKKVVSILNSSLAPVTFNCSFMFSTPELQESKVITLDPFRNITLKPKEVGKLEVTFAPKKRIPPFSEEVFMECLGLLRPLFLLSGCCQALEISLDQDHLSFGPVVYQTQASRRILLQNTGDLGARFRWDVKRFEPHFSISPEEGYITAGTDVSLEVTYRPTEVGKESLCKQLLCYIQGSSPLSLTLSGICVGLPAAKEVVNFTCQVRSKHTQTILLSNRTNKTWNLHPIFEGEHWEGPEFITLEPHQQNKPYEITYKPRTMNVENRKHQGSLFFPLPDGTGWLYTLHGTSEQPKAVANIYREVPCKTPYTELLSVSNWLNKPQRFRVIVEMLKPEKADLSVTLKGLDYIDVQAGAKKDYKLNFYSYKEGLYSAKVIFRNEQTSEYLFYTISFKAIPSGVIKTIEMVSLVRQSTSASIKLENPLPYAVTFSVDCRLPDVSLPSQFTIPGNSESVLSFEFQPLKVGESFGKLTLHSSELGYYLYELSLKALPALPEKPVHFQAVLGSSQNIFAKFINYTRQKTEYYCRTDCPDFHVEKVIIAPPGAQGGTEVSVEVYFEPSRLGETKGLLQLTSLLGGEYIIPLFGTALPPKPQGPFLIRAGYNILIPFKNIFYQPVTFSFAVEHPAFSIRAVEFMRPKKINNIAISFEGNPSGNKIPITTKLIVSCPPSESNETGVQWVYYLKGITP
ncbi:hydrocephalus-inducing protein homolog [Sorex fumeus]|uniref:hydrocephalus-inducing protein homolog n=1 Tax=Sorex fumeus TaxID=62283 RepID=UPI0024ACDB9C|nr:hydrocephalus-inducing protein homolog [Sorex fumeus]